VALALPPVRATVIFDSASGMMVGEFVATVIPRRSLVEPVIQRKNRNQNPLLGM
jgi:hypothetical protein